MQFFHFWDGWKVYCWELVWGGLRWLRLFLKLWKVRWRLKSKGQQAPVYFSIRKAYQRYASVAGKFGGHIQTLRVLLRRLSLAWNFGIFSAFGAALRSPRQFGCHLLEPEVGRGERGEKKVKKWMLRSECRLSYSIKALPTPLSHLGNTH